VVDFGVASFGVVGVDMLRSGVVGFGVCGYDILC
jgi:hypothetical protein